MAGRDRGPCRRRGSRGLPRRDGPRLRRARAERDSRRGERASSCGDFARYVASRRCCSSRSRVLPGFLPWAELADVLEEEAGLRVRRVEAPGELLRALGTLGDVLRRWLPIDDRIHRRGRALRDARAAVRRAPHRARARPRLPRPARIHPRRPARARRRRAPRREARAAGGGEAGVV